MRWYTGYQSVQNKEKEEEHPDGEAVFVFDS
jgi:hypothetical protein